MIDLRFAASALLAAVVPFLIARRAARHDQDVDYVLDIGFSAVVAGLVVARVVAVALDDPTGLGDAKSMLSVRGGVELWAGVIAIVVLVRLLRRERPAAGPPAGAPPAETALEILKKRYARGEIGKEEFEQKKRDIGT